MAKRINLISLLITLSLIMLSGCASDAAAAGEYTLADADYAVNALDIAVLGGSVCYIDAVDGKVYLADEESDSETVNEPLYSGMACADDSDAADSSDTAEGVKFLAASGNTLYIFDGGHIIRKDGDTHTVCAAPENISSLACAGDFLCWSFADESGRPKIGIYNLKNGDGISILPIFGEECRVLPCEGSKILVQCFDMTGEKELYDFDCATMKAGNFLVREQIYLAAYNDADGCVYTLDGDSGGSRMTRFDLSTGEATSLTPCDVLRDSVKKFMFSGGSAVIISDGISVRAEYINADSKTVTILADNTATQLVLTELENLADRIYQNYGTELVITKIDGDKLKLKQLAGDSDFDLYFTNNYNLVLEYQIYEPLDAYTQIIEQFDGMFDDIRRVCTYNGSIFGVPAQLPLYNAVWSCDADMLERLDLALPDAEWGVDEFYALAVGLRERGYYISAYNPVGMTSYAWEYMDAYGSGTLNDDGTILRGLLEISKKMEDEELFYSGDEPEGRGLFGADNPTAAFVWKRSDVWYKPALNGGIYGELITFLQMNVNSQNKEAAADVLAEFMKPCDDNCDPLSGVMLYDDLSLYKYSDYTLDHIDKSDPPTWYVENDLTDMDEKTAFNFEIYKNLLSRIKVNRRYSEWISFAEEQADKYYNDEQDLDYTVELILARARMVTDE